MAWGLECTRRHDPTARGKDRPRLGDRLCVGGRSWTEGRTPKLVDASSRSTDMERRPEAKLRKSPLGAEALQNQLYRNNYDERTSKRADEKQKALVLLGRTEKNGGAEQNRTHRAFLLASVRKGAEDSGPKPDLHAPPKGQPTEIQ